MGDGPDETPGDTYGSTSGRELTEIARYLSGLVREHDLPEKPFVFHQVASSVVRDQHAFRPQPASPPSSAPTASARRT